MRREGAGIVLVDIGLGAKKRDLKAERLAALGGQPTGDVPPLGAKLRMAAVIRGKYQGLTGSYGCIGWRRGSRSHAPPADAVAKVNAHQEARCSHAYCARDLTSLRARPARHPDSSRRVCSKRR